MTTYGALEHELAVLMRRARAYSRDISGEVHPDLKPTTYALLSLISDQGSARASDLCDYLGLDKSAVSRQVSLLESLGLLARERDPLDARAQRLVVTDEGNKRIETAREGRRRRMREQLDRWPEADIEQFAALLARFNRQLESAIPVRRFTSPRERPAPAGERPNAGAEAAHDEGEPPSQLPGTALPAAQPPASRPVSPDPQEASAEASV